MKYPDKRNGSLVKWLCASLVIMQSFNTALPARAQADYEQEDQKLLILLAPHTNRDQAKADLLKYAQATTVEDLHVNRDDYSILVLSPPAGQRDQTLSKILGMKAQHPEIKEATLNYKRSEQTTTMPDDPYFSDQWNLAAMKWGQAYNQYSASQVNPAQITILAGGCHTVSTNNELGAYITEYNAAIKNVPQMATVKGGSGPEGDIDCSVSGALTNNSTLISGAACFQQSKPCYITLYKIENSKGSTYDLYFFRALTTIINNQGGYFPVNISYNSGHFYTNKMIQTLASTLLDKGEIMVMAAGDTKDTLINEPTGNVAVVQATNKSNKFFLVRVQGDPIAAPGGAQPAIINGQYNSRHLGSSFAAPLWSSCIAMLISIRPNLSASQANQILQNTGTPVVDASWNAVIPNLDAAINAALQ